MKDQTTAKEWKRIINVKFNFLIKFKKIFFQVERKYKNYE